MGGDLVLPSRPCFIAWPLLIPDRISFYGYLSGKSHRELPRHTAVDCKSAYKLYLLNVFWQLQM